MYMGKESQIQRFEMINMFPNLFDAIKEPRCAEHASPCNGWGGGKGAVEVGRAVCGGGRRTRPVRSEKYAPYFFISPFYILFAVFFLFPTGFALVLGFFKWGALGTPEYYGVTNYTRLFA